MVFVLDKNKHPLMGCSHARARILLKTGRAAVFKRFPFTIILKDRVGGYAQRVRVKIDPGSKTTGIAVVRENTVVFGLNIEHRGETIRNQIESRRMIRRQRRSRKTRYRQPRFENRQRCKGWLPPSILSRIANMETWVKRLQRLIPVFSLSLESVRFDLQKLENPDIQGVEYQQGTLTGFELREYLLELHQHRCMYCNGASKDPVLNIEHIVPKNPRSGMRGTDKVSNLGIACVSCNQAKDNVSLQEWLDALSKSRLDLDKMRVKLIPFVLKRRNGFYIHASAVNVMRNELVRRLSAILPLEVGSGGLTKFNRINNGFRKDHWIDAACVGESGTCIKIDTELNPLNIKALGHGSRQFCRMDKYGFPRTKPKKQDMSVNGFRTGDMVKADVIKGKKAGRYIGRIAVRSSGYFNLLGKTLITGLSSKTMTKLMGRDGYAYMI